MSSHAHSHAEDHSSKHHSRHSSRSRSRSRSREKEHSSKHHSPRVRSRSRSPDAKQSKHSHRDRSRSRSRDDKRDHRDRSRSRSREKKSKRDKDKDKSHDRHGGKHESDDRHSSKHDRKEKSSSGSTREIERALRKAQKLLQSGGDASAIAAAGLDPSLIDSLIAQQKTAVAAAAADSSKDKEKASKADRKKKSKSTKRKAADSSSSDASSDGSDASSSSSSDDERGVSLLLSDGLTPRLFKRDYFARSTEFRLWLRETTGNSIDKMASKKAHRLFRKFIAAWNQRKLDPKYYKGLDASALGAAALTAHKWKFSKTLSESEKSKIDAVRDEIDSATHHHSYAQEFQGKQTSAQEARAEIEAVSAAALARKKEQSLHPGGSWPNTGASAAAAGSSSSGPAGPAMRPAESNDERQARIAREKIENKRLAIRQAAVLEELVPKPTGREAMLDARRAKGAYARVDRSGGDGLGEVAEADVMGGRSSGPSSAGGQSEYASLVAHRASVAAQRDQAQSQKLSAHQLKEQETMRKMLAAIGQADKYKIG